jgi:hypothetical protein
MKGLFLAFCLCLAACNPYTKPPVEPIYEALACERKGCYSLTKWKDEWDCKDFLKGIVALHQLRKDKPAFIMLCKEVIK